MAVSLEIMNKNMIDGQLKPMGINNSIILEAFKNVPRELFIDKEKLSLGVGITKLKIVRRFF